VRITTQGKLVIAAKTGIYVRIEVTDTTNLLSIETISTRALDLAHGLSDRLKAFSNDFGYHSSLFYLSRHLRSHVVRAWSLAIVLSVVLPVVASVPLLSTLAVLPVVVGLPCV
jgi:hypothetical protein